MFFKYKFMNLRECVCQKSLSYFKEINSKWVEISFDKDVIYNYSCRKISQDSYIYRIYKKNNKEQIILSTFYTIAEDTFLKNFIDFSNFREKRINEILND